jgi:hypothetical protein
MRFVFGAVNKQVFATVNPSLDFGKGFLNRVEFGGVWRKVKELYT